MPKSKNGPRRRPHALVHALRIVTHGVAEAVRSICCIAPHRHSTAPPSSEDTADDKSSCRSSQDEDEESSASTDDNEDQQSVSDADSSTSTGCLPDLPANVLLRILDFSHFCPLQDRSLLEAAIREGAWSKIRDWDAMDTVYRANLRKFALVCRAWYDHLAPLRYSKLEEADPANIDSLYSMLRSCDPSMRGHIMHVTIRPGPQYRPKVSILGYSSDLEPITTGPSFFQTSSRLIQILPDTLWLRWDGSVREAVAKLEPKTIVTHPEQAQILARAHHAFAKIAILNLKQCAFACSSDLLRLLSSLPALANVNLDNVAIEHVSSTCPRPKSTRIRCINNSVNSGYHLKVPTLVYCFTWPQLPAQHAPFGFAGIPLREAKAIALLIQLFRPGYGSSLTLEPVDDGKTWVVWYKTSILHIEFHLMQGIPNSRDPAHAHVHGLVVRFKNLHKNLRNSLVESDEQEAFPEFIRLLTELPYLQAVTFETQGTDACDKKERAMLSDELAFPIIQQTCKEAHSLLRTAREGALSKEHGQWWSPFWSQRQYAEEREYWLPKEYRDALSATDEAGI